MPAAMISQEYNNRIAPPSLLLGIIYEFSGNTFSKSRIGLYYESKLDLNKSFDNNSSPYELLAVLPHKIHFGVYHPCGEYWSYAANMTYLFWNDVNDGVADDRTFTFVKKKIGKDATTYEITEA